MSPKTVLTLTIPQRNAVLVLKACVNYADGWGILVTNPGSHEQDGQAWIQYRTGLALVRKGLAEYDEQFGRIRLI